MFSGKTEELIRRLNRARIARQQVEIFKPVLDARFSETEVVSHDENAILSTPVDSAYQIILMSGAAQVIGIDEAQFFGLELVEVCRELAESGKRVIVAGLDQDYLGKPFEPIPQLMAIAEYVTKLHAICVVCGSPANHSQRIVENTGRVVVGAGESYEPRCRRCFEPAAIAQPAARDGSGPPVRQSQEAAGLDGADGMPGWTQLGLTSVGKNPVGGSTHDAGRDSAENGTRESPRNEGDGLASDSVNLSDGSA